MPRNTDQPLARNSPNTNSRAAQSVMPAHRAMLKPYSSKKCSDRLRRCVVFFVRTLPPMVADGAGIEIVFICRFVSIVGRKKERLPSPVAYKSTKHIEVRFRFRERQPKAVYNIRVRAVLRV